MDNESYVPIPPQVQGRLRSLSHDLQRARENMANGKLRPDHYQALQKVLDGRLRELEATVEFHLLNEARTGKPGAGWQVTREPRRAS